MIQQLKNKYLDTLSIGKQEVSKNIFMSLVAKASTLAISFATVPLLLSYLGKETYGIWLTIFSVISWMSFFDLGLGNGLRNHLTHTFTQGNPKKAQEYISTAYWLLGIFIVAVLFILQIGTFFIDWDAIFKPELLLNEDLRIIVSICLWGFGALLISRLIVSILQSQKKVGEGNILLAIGSLLSLIVLVIVSKFESSTRLYHVAYIFTLASPTVLTIYSLYYFKIKNPHYKPRFLHINKSLAKDIFGLGIAFFVAQFLVMVLNQSTNIIITQILTPSEVTVYFIPLRLFSVVSIIMGLISNNLLPYFTEANAENNILKMKRIIKHLFITFILVTIFSIIILIFSKQIIEFWTANQIEIPFSLLALHLCLALVGSVNSIFSTFLNGIGKIKTQLPFLFLSVLLFVPLSLMLGKSIGLNGIVTALIVAQVSISLALAYLTKKQFTNMEINAQVSNLANTL